MNGRLVQTAMWGVLCVKAAAAFALHAGDDEFKSPGARAVRFQRAATYWIDQRYGVFDGLIANDQTSSRHYDRRFGIGLGVGVERPINSHFSLRVDGRAEIVKRRQLDAASPETTVDETRVEFRPMVAATYITPAGLEIFGGALWTVLPKYTQTIEAGASSTKVNYGAVSFLTPHLGITRRAAFGSGGVYYQFGREQKRSVVKKADDGQTLDMTSTCQEPTTLGVFSQFNGLNALWNVDFAAVSEGEGGERTESGNVVRDDHLELAVHSIWAGSWKTGVFYQTARYSKSAYMDLDSIPTAGGEFLWFTDANGQKLQMGFVGAIGRDKQSIPEVNARYEVNAFSLVGGLQSAF